MSLIFNRVTLSLPRDRRRVRCDGATFADSPSSVLLQSRSEKEEKAESEGTGIPVDSSPVSRSCGSFLSRLHDESSLNALLTLNRNDSRKSEGEKESAAEFQSSLSTRCFMLSSDPTRDPRPPPAAPSLFHQRLEIGLESHLVFHSVRSLFLPWSTDPFRDEKQEQQQET